jgi:hypothetical protein
MAFVAQALGTSTGCDTIAVFSDVMLDHMKAAVWPAAPAPTSSPILFLLRYVSLSQPFSLADITVPERDRVLAKGFLLGLVQHVERPSWQANPAVGTQHGATAAAHAKAVEYPTGCHIGVDMEGLGDQGAPVMEYIQAWAKEVHAVGFLVAMYEGYDDGLTMAMRQQLADDGTVDVFWSDYGPRADPPGIGFAMKQHPQCMVGGVQVDPDTAAPDLRGRQFIAMGISQVAANDDGQPAITPTTDVA